MAIDRLPSPGAGIPTTTVTAKGDLIAGTANNAVSRLAVGTDGQTLVADSAQATGLKWATAASTPSFKGCYAYVTSDIALANSTWVTVTMAGELFDTDNFHSTTTNNSRMTIPSGMGGYYLVNGAFTFEYSSTGSRALSLRKNGTTTIQDGQNFAGNQNYYPLWTLNWIVNLSAGDYIEFRVFQDSGITRNLLNNVSGTWGGFQIQYLGA